MNKKKILGIISAIALISVLSLGCLGGGLGQVKNLQAQKQEGNINLTWDSVSNAENYRIYRNGELLTTVDQNSYLDTDTTIGESYEYKVAAVSGDTIGENSTTVSITAGGEEVGAFGSTSPSDIPEALPQDMKDYFTQVDFDNDGTKYVFDQYLGRNDGNISMSERDGGTFNMMGEELSTWDPQQSVGTASGMLQSKIYNGLVQYVPGTTNVMPDLAKAWHISDDGLTYTFYLRENITFHNGEKMTAEDVKWSFDRLKNPAYHSPRRQWYTKYINYTEATGQYTFKIHLKKPFAPMLGLLTYSSFDVLPKDYCQAHETITGEPGNQSVEVTWTDHPVGTGPWKYKSYTPGSKAVLVENENYYAGEPYFDKIVRTFSKNPNTIVQSFNAGDIDITGIPSNHWQSFLDKEEQGKVNIIEYPELATYWIMLNCNKTIFSNTTVRQALALAMNRKKVVQDQFQGRYETAKGPLPPGIRYFPESVHQNYSYSFDLNKSRELLDRVGAVDTDGDGIREYKGKELKFELSAYTSQTWKAGAQVWMDDLEKVGIKMTYEEYGFGTLLQMGAAGNYHAMTLGWIADYPDPLNFYANFDPAQPSVNWANYQDQEVGDWISQLRTSTDPQQRKELTKKIERKLQREHPHIWFFHSREYMAVYPDTKNIKAGGLGFYKEKLINPYFTELPT